MIVANTQCNDGCYSQQHTKKMRFTALFGWMFMRLYLTGMQSLTLNRSTTCYILLAYSAAPTTRAAEVHVSMQSVDTHRAMAYRAIRTYAMKDIGVTRAIMTDCRSAIASKQSVWQPGYSTLAFLADGELASYRHPLLSFQSISYLRRPRTWNAGKGHVFPTKYSCIKIFRSISYKPRSSLDIYARIYIGTLIHYCGE